MPPWCRFVRPLIYGPRLPHLFSCCLCMQHGGEPFFGASFAPPAMPSVVSFRAALYLRPTSLSSLLVLLMQHGGEPLILRRFLCAPCDAPRGDLTCRPLSIYVAHARPSPLFSCCLCSTEVSPSSVLPLRPLRCPPWCPFVPPSISTAHVPLLSSRAAHAARS